MPKLDNYLFFDGNCAEAMRFYEKALGGKLEALLKYSDSPDQAGCAPGGAERIMHAHLVLDGGANLMASDVSGPMPYDGMKGFGVSLSYDKAADAKRAFEALAQGGQVMMPMDKTFWSEAFGMCADRFGTPWMIGGGHQAKV